MRTPPSTIVALLSTAAWAAAAFSAEHDPVRLLQATRPLVIAHRGASGIAPENTLPAFAAALEAKADLVELDYVHSADDVPVVLHDDALDRTTNAATLLGASEIKVADVLLDDLRRLDAGAWFDARFAETRLPTLEEALAAIQPGAVTLIERKAGDAETLHRLLTEHALVDQVVVQAFDWKFLADCRALDDGLVLGALGSEALTDEQLDEIAALGAAAVGWKAADLTLTSIAAARDRGLAVWAYTVNDVEEARRLVALGVTGIISDHPAEMRDGLAGTVVLQP